MRHFVTVVPHSLTAARPRPGTVPVSRETGPVLTLLVRTVSGGPGYGFTARLGPAAAHRVLGADEHYAVDADACRDPRWLSCADVLYAGRVRPPTDAERWLREVVAAFPGCRIAAAPVAGGGWAVLDGRARESALLAPRMPADRPLLASCLHTWLLIGRRVGDIQDVEVGRGL